MTITVITCTYNAAHELPRTLASVESQDYDQVEHLIIDGKSKDDTMKLVREYEEKSRGASPHRIRAVSEPDGGLYDAMNKAIRLAKGKYLIWMNAGDAFAAADSLARMAAVAGSNPGVIYGQTQVVNAERRVVGMRHLTAPAVLTADSFKHGMLVCHQAFAARRDLAPQYNLAYRFSADYDWCIRVLQQSDHNAYVEIGRAHV